MRGEQTITAETAMLLGKFFGTSARFWMGLQTQYDLDVAMDKMGVTLSEYENITVTESAEKQNRPQSESTPVSASTGR